MELIKKVIRFDGSISYHELLGVMALGKMVHSSTEGLLVSLRDVIKGDDFMEVMGTINDFDGGIEDYVTDNIEYSSDDWIMGYGYMYIQYTILECTIAELNRAVEMYQIAEANKLDKDERG